MVTQRGVKFKPSQRFQVCAIFLVENQLSRQPVFIFFVLVSGRPSTH